MNNPDLVDEDTKENAWVLGFFGVHLLQSRLPAAQEAAAAPGSPLIERTAPVKWLSTGANLALPQQVPDAVQSQDRSEERSSLCKGLC